MGFNNPYQMRHRKNGKTEPGRTKSGTVLLHNISECLKEDKKTTESQKTKKDKKKEKGQSMHETSAEIKASHHLVLLAMQNVR